MELNKLILFLIIIFLSIIIFKCAKIFNIKKIEKFSFRGQKGFTDDTGHVLRNLDNMLNDTTYLRCDGDWGSCSNQSGCQQVYNITTDNYIGEPCPHESGATSECIPDWCSGSSGETYLFKDSNGATTEYNIIRNMDITHTQGGGESHIKFDEYNPTAEEDPFWVSIGDDTNIQLRANIQLQKLNRIMELYKSHPDFIGIQKETDTTGDKFYPIIVHNNSAIKENPNGKSVLYMKAERDCRGTWGHCYGSTTMDNVESGSSIDVVQREYTINIPPMGNGSECEADSGAIENCAYWGPCSRLNPNGIRDMNKSYWRIPNKSICQNGENNNCNGDKYSSTIAHCLQTY